MPLKVSKLIELRDQAQQGCDFELPPVNVELQQHWSESSAAKFFQTGGLSFPPSCVSVDGASAQHQNGRQLIVLLPDNEEELETWCVELRRQLEEGEGGSDLLVRVIFPSRRILQALDQTRAAQVAELLGEAPERTVVVGRTEGADCLLHLLEQRRLGGGVLLDLKNRLSFLWKEIQKHAGPRGGNLALVNSEPPHGSRFPEKFGAKLGVQPVEAVRLAWAVRAAVRGVAGAEPRRVRILAFTAGLGREGFGKWATLPAHVELCLISHETHLPTDTAVPPGDLAALGQRIAAELIDGRRPAGAAGATPGASNGAAASCLLDRPTLLFGHDWGAWLAYEVLSALEARRRAAGAGEVSWRMPSTLVVSAMRAPHLCDPDQHDPDVRTPRLARLEGTDRFYSAFGRRYGLHPLLDASSSGCDHSTRRALEPTLRGQMALVESYRPSCGARAAPITPHELRVIAVGAKGDDRVLEGHLQAWEGYIGEAPPRVAAVAQLAGRLAGEDDTASFVACEFDLYDARMAEANRKADADARSQTAVRSETSTDGVLRLTYRPTSSMPADFVTGEPHRYVMETPAPLVALLAAEASLLGYR